MSSDQTYIPISSSRVRTPSGVLRLSDGKFAPGSSGNPGGRPRAAHHVVELARQHTNLAIEALAGIAGDPSAPEFARIAASATLLDRGWGKPIQANPAMHEHFTRPDARARITR